MGEITIVPRQKYIALCCVKIRKDMLRITIYAAEGTLEDPEHMAHKFPFDHWGKGDYEADIHDTADVDALMLLLEQAYQQAG